MNHEGAVEKDMIAESTKFTEKTASAAIFDAQKVVPEWQGSMGTQWMACLRGEHESKSGDEISFETADGEDVYYGFEPKPKYDKVWLLICRHCRSVYVPR